MLSAPRVTINTSVSTSTPRFISAVVGLARCWSLPTLVMATSEGGAIQPRCKLTAAVVTRFTAVCILLCGAVTDGAASVDVLVNLPDSARSDGALGREAPLSGGGVHL